MGDETTIETGIVKPTLRVLPTIVVTAVAVVVPPGGPVVAGLRLTETLAASIAPVGKPEPVTLMFVMPAWPTLGEVGELSVTVICACRGDSSAPARRFIKSIAVTDQMYRQVLIYLSSISEKQLLAKACCSCQRPPQSSCQPDPEKDQSSRLGDCRLLGFDQGSIDASREQRPRGRRKGRGNCLVRNKRAAVR
jgi:hypothetical protein